MRLPKFFSVHSQFTAFDFTFNYCCPHSLEKLSLSIFDDQSPKIPRDLESSKLEKFYKKFFTHTFL